MRNTFLTALLAAVMASSLAHAQGADEKEIRTIISALNEGKTRPFTDDSVFWSGALVKPQTRGEKAETRPGSSAGNRTNDKQVVTVKQLRVSSSGDMAYEYSTFKSSWDRKDNGKHIEREGALLRVWRKVSGGWQIAASFQHPYDPSPAEG